MLLKENLNLSEENFRTSKNLSEVDGNYLAIEYAHSLFGIAEAKRLETKHDVAMEYYDKAYGMYQKTGILWGIIRTSIGSCMIEPTHKLRENLKRESDDPIDKKFIDEFNNNTLNAKSILFLNIP